jgi:hypothetical protein
MMEEVRTFHYSPLSGNDSIRLLILQADVLGSDIHCSLIHTNLRACYGDIFEHYTALSYVWGNANNKRTTYLNEIPFEITVNLLDALDDLRDEHNTLRLWVDAICIDQANILERNQQVALMRQIYSYAAFTVVYLGKSIDEVDEVMCASHDTKFDSRLQDIVATQILSRPWFTRVWVYQELVLSVMPWVQCGRRRVRWDALYVGLFGKEDEKDADENDGEEEGSSFSKEEDEDEKDSQAAEMSRFKPFSDMNAARRQKPGPPSLFSVLVSRRGFKATNLRDLVYGHLAVARLPSRTNIAPCPVVDYQRSTVNVFTDAAGICG